MAIVKRVAVLVWAALLPSLACSQSQDQQSRVEGYVRAIDITWVEKYVTYEQDSDGNLRETDVHFLAETIYSERSEVEKLVAILFADSGTEPIATFGADDPHDFTNGMFWTRKSKSYDDIDRLEAAYPAEAVFNGCVRATAMGSFWGRRRRPATNR